jgi:hypothetical protein
MNALKIQACGWSEADSGRKIAQIAASVVACLIACLVSRSRGVGGGAFNQKIHARTLLRVVFQTKK